MVTVGSYNIWMQGSPSFWGQKQSREARGEAIYRAYSRNWNDRVNDLVTNILNSQTDIISLEEVTKPAFADLNALLVSHGYISASSELALHPGRAHGIAVFYRQKKVELLSSPPASFIALNGVKKAFIGNFRVTDSSSNAYQKIICFAACHLDGGPTDAGDRQLNDLRSKLSFLGVDATVITGDLNRDQSTTLTLNRIGQLIADQFQSHDPAHEETELGTGRHLDWIFVQSKAAKVINAFSAGQQKIASDHALVAASLDFPRAVPPGPSEPIGPIFGPVPFLPGPLVAPEIPEAGPSSEGTPLAQVVAGFRLTSLGTEADAVLARFATWINTTYQNNGAYRLLVPMLHDIIAKHQTSDSSRTPTELWKIIHDEFAKGIALHRGGTKYILPQFQAAMNAVFNVTPPTPAPTPLPQTGAPPKTQLSFFQRVKIGFMSTFIGFVNFFKWLFKI